MSQILDKLIRKYQLREEVGLSKYKTTMDRSDLSLEDWIQHLLEELMDATIYLTKIKQLYEQGYSNNQKASTTTNVSPQPNRKAKHIGTPVRKIQKTKLQGSRKRSN